LFAAAEAALELFATVVAVPDSSSTSRDLIQS
jgi:hypothetical protein